MINVHLYSVTFRSAPLSVFLLVTTICFFFSSDLRYFTSHHVAVAFLMVLYLLKGLCMCPGFVSPTKRVLAMSASVPLVRWKHSLSLDHHPAALSPDALNSKAKREQRPDTHTRNSPSVNRGLCCKCTAHVRVPSVLLFPKMKNEISIKKQWPAAPSSLRCNDSDYVQT